MAQLVVIALAALLCGAASPAAAQGPYLRPQQVLFGTRSADGCAQIVFDANDLPMSVVGGKCLISRGADIPAPGACIGSPNDTGGGSDWCNDGNGGADFTGRSILMTDANREAHRVCPQPGGSPCDDDGDCSTQSGAHVCLAGRCVPTVAGSSCYHADLKTMITGDGTTVAAAARALPGALGTLGGTGADGVFRYAGETAATGTCSTTCSNNSGRSCSVAGDCTVCQGGTVSGSGGPPNGTCSLTRNSHLLRSLQMEASSDVHTTDDHDSVVRNFTTVTFTGGILTAARVGTCSSNACTDNSSRYCTGDSDCEAGVNGAALILRATGPIALSGGTVDLVGLGLSGVKGGTPACNNAGKRAGSTVYFGGAGGAAGNNAGGTGVSAALDPILSLFTLPLVLGTGGSTAPVSGQVAPRSFGPSVWGPNLGGTGGGGPGCASGCTTTTYSAGGDGGGFLRLESARSIALSGTYVIDVRGESGSANGSAGAGAGGVHLIAPSITPTSPTVDATNGSCSGTGKICTGGGNAGTGSPAGCGNGGAGGDGLVIVSQVPAW